MFLTEFSSRTQSPHRPRVRLCCPCPFLQSQLDKFTARPVWPRLCVQFLRDTIATNHVRSPSEHFPFCVSPMLKTKCSYRENRSSSNDIEPGHFFNSILQVFRDDSYWTKVLDAHSVSGFLRGPRSTKAKRVARAASYGDLGYKSLVSSTQSILHLIRPRKFPPNIEVYRTKVLYTGRFQVIRLARPTCRPF